MQKLVQQFYNLSYRQIDARWETSIKALIGIIWSHIRLEQELNKNP